MKEVAAKKVLTLVYIVEQVQGNAERRILLGLKKRGFGEGKWNGFGGKVQEGETIEQAAVREVHEECGLDVAVSDLDKKGVIDFEFVGDPVHLEVHVYLTGKYKGEVIESEEMAPKWFSLASMPYDKMWPDDIHWHPIIFRGEKFEAYFLFEGLDKILEHKIDIKDAIEK